MNKFLKFLELVFGDGFSYFRPLPRVSKTSVDQHDYFWTVVTQLGPCGSNQ